MGDKALPQTVGCYEGLLDLAVLVVHRDEGIRRPHRVRHQRSRFERCSDRNVHQLPRLVQPNVEVARDEHRVVAPLLRPDHLLQRPIRARMAKVDPLIVPQRVRILDIHRVELGIRTSDSREILLSEWLAPAKGVDDQDLHGCSLRPASYTMAHFRTSVHTAGFRVPLTFAAWQFLEPPAKLL